MQLKKYKITLPRLALGLANLCAALIIAANSASAAPTKTVLYSFAGGSDGTYPLAPHRRPWHH